MILRAEKAEVWKFFTSGETPHLRTSSDAAGRADQAPGDLPGSGVVSPFGGQWARVVHLFEGTWTLKTTLENGVLSLSVLAVCGSRLFRFGLKGYQKDNHHLWDSLERIDRHFMANYES